MKLSSEITIMLHNTTRICLANLTGEQNAIVRFVWCCVDKIFLCTSSLKTLIPLAETNDDIEFSIGIILRSMLMDSILIQRVVGILNNHTNNEQIDVTSAYAAVDAQCMIYVADGTIKIIDMLYADNKIPQEQKIVVCRNIANKFPDVFDTTGDKPVRNVKFKPVVIQKEYEATLNKDKTNTIIYNNYNIYSKYDHVSHWSSELRNISEKERRSRIESSLLMILLSLRELLKLPYLFSPKHKEAISNSCKHIDEYFRSLKPIEN